MLHKVSGIVDEDGAPVSRVVRVYRADTGTLLGEVTSDPVTGEYEITHGYSGSVFVKALPGQSQRALVHGEMVSMSLNVSYEDLVIADGPVAYWRLDETEGSVAIDATGNGHDATYHGGELGVAGLINEGTAVHLDGTTSDWISVPHHADLSSDDQSIELWFQAPASAPDDPKGLAYKAPDTGFNSEIGLALRESGKIGFFAADGGVNTVSVETANTFVDGEVHHVVFTKVRGATEDTISVYVDGDVKISQAIGFHIFQGTNEIVFGKVSSDSDPARYFQGPLDEIAVYSRALTPQEINEHYLVGKV